MLAYPFERFRNFSYWAGLRATLPFSMFRGQCGAAGFGVLMYHRVCDPVQGIAAPTWNVTPARLRSQLEYLLDKGYEAWRLADLVDFANKGKRIPRRAFAVTFDDGYRCVATEAAPILKSLEIPATVFLATGLLGAPGRMPQDDWEGAGDIRVPRDYYEPLSEKDCDWLLKTNLFELGSHTHTHQDFRGREKAFEDDIRASAEFMRQRWGLKHIPFAFPYGCSRKGFCTSAMRDAVRRVGFFCALTADAKIVNPQADDVYGWGRIVAHDTDSGRLLAAKLDNWYGAFKRFSLGQLASLSV